MPESRPTNRLIDESSPYLLQHAHNPVDWRPWGPEAFAEARARDVPIFLSIGYSTCYWCHVMERESFEDEATARVMNERFVCIKVDREERPDVDDLYMAATQLMTGSGGWPMSVFLEPESLKPFWCGTYFPAEPMHGRPSFTQVLLGLSDVWTKRRDEVIEQAGNLADAVRDHLASEQSPAALGGAQIASAVRSLLQIYDRTEGGFGGAPKFPQPIYGLFLLEARPIVDEETRGAIDHALGHTLDRMAVGGLFDQAGGGFHRYCVDGTWTVPHFEKMLYDNAQLLSLYSRAAMLYDDPFYREIVGRTVEYLRREMMGAGWRLLSAQDAEVGGREGLNYIWVESEVTSLLDADDAAFAKSLYGLDRGGNFTDPHHPSDGPKTVLRLDERPDALAARSGIPLEEFNARRARVNSQLLEHRIDAREPPGLDDKSIAAWNGMAIVGLADAARALDDETCLNDAERIARFVLEHMRDRDGSLHRSFRSAAGGHENASARLGPLAGLEDYAWMIEACVTLHDAERGDGVFLDEAAALAERAHAIFQTDEGWYADTAAGRTDLFVRARSTYDGATPSAISVMINALIGLHDASPPVAKTGGANPNWLDRARTQLAGVSRAVAERPVSTVNSVRGVIEFIRLEGDTTGLAFGEDLTPEGTRPGATSSAGCVEVFADEESVTVRDGEPASFTLGIRVRQGYHILAADPAVSAEAARGLVPLRVGLISGQGVAVYAEYPEGDPYGEAIVGRDDLRVHTGEVRLRVALEKQPGIGASEGEPVLGITLQACDDAACLKPATIRLGVGIRIE